VPQYSFKVSVVYDFQMRPHSRIWQWAKTFQTQRKLNNQWDWRCKIVWRHFTNTFNNGSRKSK